MAYLTNTVKNVEGTEISIDDSYKLKDYELEGDTYQLPDGYTQVEYIQSSGTQYIDTGYIFNANDNIKIKVMPLEANVDKTIFGEYSSGKVCELGYLSNAFRGNVGSGGPTYSINNIYEIELINGRWSYNGTAFGSIYNNTAEITCYLFARNYGNDLKRSVTRFYDLKIIRNNNIIHHFIPCYRNSDNVIGIYDIINNKFKTNIGTGTFTKGNDAILPTPDYPQEIHTVTGRQNINVVGKNLFNPSNFVSKMNQTIDQTTGIISSSGGSSSGWSYDNCFYKTTLKAGTYTTTQYFITKSDINYGLFRIYREDNTLIESTSNYNIDTATITFTLNEKTNIGIATKAGACSYYLQLEKNNQATTYEEYKSASYEINLGKNLFDTGKRTDYTVPDNNEFYGPPNWLGSVENGIVSMAIQGAGGTVIYKNQRFEGNKTYSISLKASATYSRLYVRFRKKDNSGWMTSNETTITGWSYNSYYRGWYRENGNVTDVGVTLSTPDCLYLQFGIGYTSMAAIVGTIQTISNIQIEKGTEATSYSEYFEPIWLGGINDYKDKIKKSSGKNLFDKDNAVVLNAYIDRNTTTITSNNINRLTYIKCEPNTTYTVSASIYGTNVINSTTLGLADTLPQIGTTCYGINEGSSGSRSITTGNNTQYLVVRYKAIAPATLDNLKDFLQIEKASSSSEYEPYGTNWYLKKEIGKVVLNGSENWTDYTTQYTNYYTSYCTTKHFGQTVSMLSTDKYMINNFQSQGADFSAEKQFISSSLYAIYLKISSSIVSTANDLKTWLGNNNAIVYYVLATPTYETITDTTLIEQLEAIRLLYGYNNITVDNIDLSATLSLDYYSTENPYQDAIYSQDDKNDLKIYFNDVELEDAGRYCEKITRTARILPSDGNKRFSLDNFISTSVDVILHDVDLEDIVDQVRIEIGTDIGNNTYQYVPLGIFNIQDTPVKDKNKITLKLRDNRVKFDFNYNAYPLMESLGGTATKRQILEDICEQAGVENIIDHFDNEEDELGIYDNSITATTYVSYLMEQAGLIPIINREGKLATVNLGELDNWRIPLSIVESYEKGEPYEIDRVVYESGIIKYETSNDETLDTLYINSANPYVFSDSQVQNILNKLQGFEIDSVTTKRVLGNPAIDPYDIIEIYDDLNGTNDVVFRTLANTTYTFNGVHRDKFDTQIGKEERTENVTKNSEASYRKLAKTEIDNINANILLVSSTTESYHEDSLEQINNLATRTNTVEQRITSTEANIEVMEQQIVDGQQTLRNNLVTIDINGINVSTNTSAIATLMTNEKFVIRSGDTILAFFGYDAEINSTKAEMDNLTVTNYFISGYHRTEKMNVNGEKRTGQFFIGGRL